MFKTPVHVLVADRDVASRKDLTRRLTEAGYLVVPAASAGDVFLQCEIDPPDVLIIDVRLPDMDGYDVCTQLRLEPTSSDMPIVLTTTVRDPMSRGYLAKMVEFSGGDYFIAKPYDVNVLVKLVSAIARGGMNRSTSRLEEDACCGGDAVRAESAVAQTR